MHLLHVKRNSLPSTGKGATGCVNHIRHQAAAIRTRLMSRRQWFSFEWRCHKTIYVVDQGTQFVLFLANSTSHRFGQVRLIHAPRIFGQEIARGRVRPRARPAANLAVLAHAAFPVATIGIAQEPEQRRVAVQVDQRSMPYIACGKGQESTGEYLAGVRDEYESASIAHPGGAPHGTLRIARFDRRPSLR